MLPKPDKSSKKKPLDSEQLDLVDTLGKEKRLRHRRRFTAIVLILTVGLSLGFWTYRYLKFSLPQVNLKFNLSRSPSPASDFIPKYASSWSVYIRSNDSHWSQNFTQNPEPLVAQLTKVSPSSTSLIKDTLPSGVEIKEIFENISPQLFFAAYQISVPQKQITIFLRLPESEKAFIPNFIEKVYWHLLSLP